MSTPPERTRRWKAKWIWSETQDQESNVYYYFRKAFDLWDEREGYRLFVTSDTRYQLFLNGGFVGRGTPQSQPFFQYYDEYEVDDCLQGGRNCVALIVNHVGNLPDTRGGLLLEIVDDAREPVLCTDETWRVARAEAWREDTYAYHGNKTTPYQEFFDARREPRGWR